MADDIVTFNGPYVGEIYIGEEWTIKNPGWLDQSGTTVVYDAVVRR